MKSFIAADVVTVVSGFDSVAVVDVTDVTVVFGVDLVAAADVGVATVKVVVGVVKF